MTEERCRGVRAKIKLFEREDLTLYIPESEMRLMAGNLQGNYEGIGIQFDIFKDTVIVIEPLEGGPSKDLGIQWGDKILTVDGDRSPCNGPTSTKTADLTTVNSPSSHFFCLPHRASV